MYAIAHGGVRTHVRESALKVDSGEKSLAAPGIEPASAACRSDALPTELHPRLLLFQSKVITVFKTLNINHTQTD